MAEETKPSRVVMVVQDERVLREMLQDFLTMCGFTAYSASNGREALDLLATRPHPRLILLDPLMPVMNGWEFMRNLKEDESTAAIPVVVISANKIDPESIGAVRAICMPLRLQDILDVVEAYCGPSSDGSDCSQP